MTNIRRALQAAAASGGDATYVEDVFSLDTYRGASSADTTITNGIDLDGEGGLVWVKQRGPYTDNHYLVDTERGRASLLSTNNDSVALTGSPAANDLKTFNSDGFTLGTAYNAAMNSSPRYYGSWTFRKAEKFFTMVKFTADATFDIIAHDLGSMPGFVIYKCISSASDVTSGDWQCWHSSLDNNDSLVLNTDAAEVGSAGFIGDVTSTQCQFYCTSGEEYIAYYFGNDEAAFGADSDETIIKCGAFTTTASWGMANVTLGWEPQFVIMKKYNTTGDWYLLDAARGMNVPYRVGGEYFANTGAFYSDASTSDDPTLYVNTTAAEADQGYINPHQQGFIAPLGSTADFIYIAIRRPMKPPTAGTDIFKPLVYSGGQSNPQVLTLGIAPDVTTIKMINGTSDCIMSVKMQDNQYLKPSSTAAQGTASDLIPDFGYSTAAGEINLLDGGSGAGEINGASAYNYVCEAFKRAPEFMDVAMWMGTGANRTVNHNLGVEPEMMWVKRRDGSADWAMYAKTGIAGQGDKEEYGVFNNDSMFYDDDTYWNDTAPTSTVFTVGTNVNVNDNTESYIAFLWASVAGVSKVGAYSGTGVTQNIDCGFSARYVMIKRTDSGGAWIYLDSARGLTPTPTEPFLRYNSNVSEITWDDYVRGHADGFTVVGTAGESNASGATYVFLAIA